MIEKALDLLKKFYGYDSFRRSQERVVKSILSGKDTLGILPTGGGKSICYQIPALVFKGTTIVVSPLISLMKDQVDQLHEMGIPATYLNSSLTKKEFVERLRKISEEAYKIVYVAPERLSTESFSTLVSKMNIPMVAVDEAHCVSKWGHDFRPSYLRIPEFLKRLREDPIVAAFTATATEKVREDIVSNLLLNKPLVHMGGFDRPNLSFSVLRGVNRKEYLLSFLRSRINQTGVVYASTRKTVENLHEYLMGHGFAAGRYHAGLSDSERKEMQEAFLYDDIQVMIATNAFGMGIDKSNVRWVVHYNMPGDLESYYQEAGRAGRDGEPGECIMLFAPNDVNTQRYFIEESEADDEVKRMSTERLNRMVGYCHTDGCLRSYILSYFGESSTADECGNCSNCNDTRERRDVTIDTQKILSCVKRMKERFGAAMVAMVLKGSKDKRVQEFGFEQLSTYGIMEVYPKKIIGDLIQFLISENYLELSDGKYPVLSVTERGMRVLKGSEKVFKKEWRIEMKQDSDLFERLRRLRRELAYNEGVPPYIIFSDKTLKEMSAVLPEDMGEMLRIKGLGLRKYKKYGKYFLEEIVAYLSDNPDAKGSRRYYPED